MIQIFRKKLFPLWDLYVNVIVVISQKWNEEGHRVIAGESMVSNIHLDGVECIQLWSNTADCQRNVQQEQST